MCPVPMKIRHESSKVLETYVLLNSCSQGAFVEEQLLDELLIPGRKTTITVKTLNSDVTKLGTVVEELKGPILGLQQFLTTESPLKMTKMLFISC